MTVSMTVPPAATEGLDVRVAVVGAGFSGLGAAIRMKQSGIENFVVLERAADLGGTWRDNTYPGCACDVPSHLYSFSFAPNPNWSHVFARHDEIWAYLRDCAERFRVTPHIRYEHEVSSAQWDDASDRWRIQTSEGELTARVLVAGAGPLSQPSIPKLTGLASFKGKTFHSARWDHEHYPRGRKVAVIGTGASAIQFVPEIQPQVGHLTLFQRTAPWVLPRPEQRIGETQKRVFRALPAAQRAIRGGMYWAGELGILGLAYDPRLTRPLEALGRAHLRAQVPDRQLREKLTPDFRLGCKRILGSSSYYPALTQPNATVVTDPIKRIRARSIETADGEVHEAETIIFGTGFHVTDSPVAEAVHGRGGRSLAQAWQGSPQAYLGTTVAGFPNLFMLVGPNSGLGNNSIVFIIESQVNYLLDALRTMEANQLASVEVRPQVQQAFNEEVQRRMRGSVWTDGGCASWYLDANGRNTTLWPDFTWRYYLRTRRFDMADYRGRLDLAPAAHTPAPLQAVAA